MATPCALPGEMLHSFSRRRAQTSRSSVVRMPTAELAISSDDVSFLRYSATLPRRSLALTSPQ